MAAPAAPAGRDLLAGLEPRRRGRGSWHCRRCGYEWGDGAAWAPRRLIPPPPTEAEWSAALARRRRADTHADMVADE